jgi:hypothetical protein
VIGERAVEGEPLQDVAVLWVNRERLPETTLRFKHVSDADRVVPDLERLHRRIVGHLVPVTLAPPSRFGLGQSEVAPRDDHARDQSFQVPFPWSRKGFIEIADVDYHIPLRCGGAAEVQQMRVPAGLHPQSRLRGRCQIGRHDAGRAPIEREGRLQHPSEADRNELRQPVLVGFNEQFDRITPILRRFPPTVRLSRRSVAQSFSLSAALIRRRRLYLGASSLFVRIFNLSFAFHFCLVCGFAFLSWPF